VSFFLLAFPALFSIVNPLGGAFIFLGATEHSSAKVRRELAKWIAIYSFAIVTASMYVGAYVLTFFGISISVLRAAGGIVIAAAAWRMLNAPDDEAPKTGDEVGADLAATRTISRSAFYPLTMPITTGPGTISVAVSLGTNRPRATAELLSFIGQSMLAIVRSALSSTCSTVTPHRCPGSSDPRARSSSRGCRRSCCSASACKCSGTERQTC